MASVTLLLGVLFTSSVTTLTSDPAVAHPPAIDNGFSTIAAPSAREMRLERQGNQVRVYAQVDIEADLATIWATLSDYDHLAEFIPNMSLSRVISRDGPNVVVEQKGTVGFGLIRRSFAVIFAVTEHLNESISMSELVGDFGRFDARYEIVPLALRRWRVAYDATIEPWSSAPQLLSDAAMRLIIGDQFDALIHEISRRGQVI